MISKTSYSWSTAWRQLVYMQISLQQSGLFCHRSCSWATFASALMRYWCLHYTIQGQLQLVGPYMKTCVCLSPRNIRVNRLRLPVFLVKLKLGEWETSFRCLPRPCRRSSHTGWLWASYTHSQTNTHSPLHVLVALKGYSWFSTDKLIWQHF